MVERRSVLKAMGVATGIGLTGTGAAQAKKGRSKGKRGPSNESGEQTHLTPNEQFVATWSEAPTPPSSNGPSHTGFANQTLREVVHTSVGGTSVRVRLTNVYGNQSVTFDSVTVGIRDSDASVTSGTNRTVTFGGEQSVFIPSGSVAYSDPINLKVDAEQDLLVSLYTSDATGTTTYHPLALHNTYVASGDHATDVGGAAFTDSIGSWFFLEGVDVVANENTGTIVALGDSITDGYHSTFGADHTWPNYLAQRLVSHKSVHRSIVNAGISGNRVLHDSLSGYSFGNNALARLDHDVLSQPGVSDVILLEGINDIGQRPPAVTADQIIEGLKQIAFRLHAHPINVFAGTLTPDYGSGKYYGSHYDSPASEAKRQQINDFIRTTDVFDGVIDFDKAIRDPNQPDRMLPKYDSGQHLHPNDRGYKAMADAVDLSLFKGNPDPTH